MKNFFFLLLLLLFCCSCPAQSNFVKVSSNGHFTINNKPYYYIGTNFWYGAILASQGRGGNRARLNAELDNLHKLGLNNLRILVGADGNSEVVSKVKPTLQYAPGIYNDTILNGLDYLLVQMKKRNMRAVLYLNNAWEWTGGYSQYLAWAKHDIAPVPAVQGWPAYMEYVKEFVFNDSAKALFNNHVKFVINRTNRYTHQLYKDDPTIMTWEIANEPRSFSQEGKAPFKAWLRQVSALIKSIDPHHLVTSGTEGKHGCEEDIQLFEDIHADPNIDYLCMHLWPYNWSWVDKTTIQKNLSSAETNTKKYIEEHLTVARRLKKPIVMEEYGYPRDNFSFKKSSSTQSRDAYYQFIYNLLIANKEKEDVFAGCNFWGWGGMATPTHLKWQWGDDYCGDPAQEEQGLNSVFASDKSTLQITRTAARQLKTF
jgi:mannan endo-1,4-beta-mannosidase